MIGRLLLSEDLTVDMVPERDEEDLSFMVTAQKGTTMMPRNYVRNNLCYIYGFGHLYMHIALECT